MRRLRHSKQNNITIPTMTLTPLIDTVLVLLIVFMVGAPSKIITPPTNKKSSTVQKARAEDYRVAYVYVGSDGTIIVNGQAHDQKSVIKNMATLVAQSPIKTVYIKNENSSANTKTINALVGAVCSIPGARAIVS